MWLSSALGLDFGPPANRGQARSRSRAGYKRGHGTRLGPSGVGLLQCPHREFPASRGVPVDVPMREGEQAAADWESSPRARLPPSPGDRFREARSVARIVSFVVLAAIVILFGALFIHVMARFLLPIFLALVLVVMFRPLHQWFVDACGGRTRVAALLTTAMVLLIVLVPVGALVARAASEGLSITQQLNRDELLKRLKAVRTRLYLALPEEPVRNSHQALQESISWIERISGAVLRKHRGEALTEDANFLQEPDSDPAQWLKRARDQLQALGVDVENGLATRHLPRDPKDPKLAEKKAAEMRVAIVDLRKSVENVVDNLSALIKAPPHEQEPNPAAGQPTLEQKLDDALTGLDLSQAQLTKLLYGPPLLQWLREKANPDNDEARLNALQEGFGSWAGPLAFSTTQKVGGIVAKILVGLGIMIVSLYYFLADGPSMAGTIMRLSPLEERYERQILSEFDKVCRAVVVATLLSAMVQGVLAGIGYYVAGLDGVILLSVITMVLAMVPFVGAAAVWGSCAAWLLLYDERTMAAALLALYGACIVSMADNVIKPLVLHGQSNIHPLLALLSVLGGVTALGPIGIFVGPMVVAFLHAVLYMLNAELTALSSLEAPKPSKTLD